MYAIKLQHHDFQEESSSSTDNDAFAETTVMNEIDSNATTQVLAMLNDMDATVVLPSAHLLQAERNQPAMNDAGALQALSVAELIATIRENSVVMRLSLERIATAALAGERYPFEAYRRQLQHLADACALMQLGGLQQFFAHLADVTCRLDAASSMEVLQACKILDRWPVLVVDYLNRCGETEPSKMLCQYATSSGLYLRMTPDAAAAMLDALILPP